MKAIQRERERERELAITKYKLNWNSALKLLIVELKEVLAIEIEIFSIV